MINYFLCSSVGVGKTKLTSFDNALLQSGLANYNLVKVSSILPPKCQHRDRIELPEGSLIYTAFSSITVLEPNLIASSSVAVGLPFDENMIGVIMEYSSICSRFEAIITVENMVKEAMLSRNNTIKQIKTSSIEVHSDGESYVTALSCLAMW